MGHSHSHDTAFHDHSLMSNAKGIRALKISLIGLLITAVFQLVIFYYSGSAALLADTLHNFVDAFTAVPLWLAFILSRRKPDQKFTYGYNRIEDLVGLFIVFVIFGTAFFVGYDSINKLRTGFVPTHLNWVIAASIIGFLGNEAVARYRIKIGEEIHSAALVADGHHARADGYTSLGVLFGAIGVYLGFPMADPLVGIIIALAIVHVGWTTGKQILDRLMDAIPPDTINEIRNHTKTVEGVLDVADVRARYSGQQLRVDITIEVDGEIKVKRGHEIAIEVHHSLKKAFPHLVSPNIHVDPSGMKGEKHHFHD